MTPPAAAAAKVLQFVNDGLRNVLTGLGTRMDKSVGTSYTLDLIDKGQLEAAYRGDWIARKIVDAPADDATREWRAWQAEGDTIGLIEKTERRLKVQQKLRWAMKLARLYGGGALILGIKGQGDSAQPFNVERVGKEGFTSLHAVSQHDINKGPDLITDIDSPWFGEPTYYERVLTNVSNMTQTTIKIHPSRIVKLLGREIPDPNNALTANNNLWGDSVLLAVDSAVKAAGIVSGGIAALVPEAKVDVIKIPNLTENLTTVEYENKLMDRLDATYRLKSLMHTLLMDVQEEHERIEVNFSTLPEIFKMYLLVASGAADIPATRLLGQSAQGLNATGESDMRNYYDRVKSDQTTTLQPAIETLDELILRSATGSRDEDLFYEWNPLWQMTEQEKAEVASKKADVMSKDVAAGLIPLEALRVGRQNQLIEDGTYPGLEQAIDDFEEEVAPAEETRQLALEQQQKLLAAPLPEATNKSRPFGDHFSDHTPGGHDHDQKRHGLQGLHSAESIASSLREAHEITENIRNKIATRLDALPNGYEIKVSRKIFVAQNVGSDRFWIEKNKGQEAYTSRQFWEKAGGGVLKHHILLDISLEDFNPYHRGPGERGGQFTYAPVTSFVSPNVSNLAFQEALTSLESERQEALKNASDDVDREFGIRGTNTPVVGAWADGAENSMMVVMPSTDYQTARIASAMKGHLANQKSVLLFQPSSKGKEFLASFEVNQPIDKTHANMLKQGLTFHTLEPMAGGTRVHAFGQDQATLETVGRIARSNGTEARFTKGTGEFLGTQKPDSVGDIAQRADARRIYETVISNAGRVRGRDVGNVWQDVRNRWSSSLKDWMIDYNPNQPRKPKGVSEGGQFTFGFHSRSQLSPAAKRRDRKQEEAEKENKESRRREEEEAEWRREYEREEDEELSGKPETKQKIKEAFNLESHRDEDKLSHLWDEHLSGIEPQEFKQKLLGSKVKWDGDPSVRINSEGALSISGAIEGGGSISREIDFVNGEAHHSYFSIPKSMQGKGVAKDIIKSQIELYQDIGINEVRLSANIDVGAYAWAKYGFLPENGSISRGVADTIRSNLSDIPEAASLLAKFNDWPDNPTALWEIADSPYGKTALRNNSWAGVLDLNNEDQMERLRKYVK